MRIYLSGPMRGIRELNFPAFDAARDLLLKLGHDPVSPADMDRADPVQLPIQQLLRRDIGVILTCDAIAFLPGWEDSVGARIERQTAEAIGLPCFRVFTDHGRFYPERLIGIAGFARVGKDTFADFLGLRGFEKRSLAAPLKGILYGLDPIIHIGDELTQDGDGHARIDSIVDALGWEDAKTHPEIRRLLQRLGTEGGRKNLWEDVWVDALFRRPSNGRIAIPDVRFPNEAEAVRARGGVVIRIERPGIEAANAHISEHALAEFKFDRVIVNDGTLGDLLEKAYALLAETGF